MIGIDRKWSELMIGRIDQFEYIFPDKLVIAVDDH